MKKATKTALIIAASLVLAGIIIFAAGMTAADWDFQILSNREYTTVTHCVSVGFTDIIINSSNTDITFAVSDDGGCRVVCYEYEKRRHTVSVENGALLITEQKNLVLRDHIGVDFETSNITVYLPKGDYGMLNISNKTGDISIPADFHFKNADISVSTGDVNYNACGENIKIKASTGDITLAGVNANTITVSASTGDVKLEKCDAATLDIKTNTGDITGTICTEKVFVYKTSTGKVSLPQTQSGGEFRLTTSTGDIKIEIAG